MSYTNQDKLDYALDTIYTPYASRLGVLDMGFVSGTLSVFLKSFFHKHSGVVLYVVEDKETNELSLWIQLESKETNEIENPCKISLAKILSELGIPEAKIFLRNQRIDALLN